MLNKVILMGRLTRDPDFKATPSGTSVCNFSLAVDRDFVRQGEERQTDFINIVTFGSRAEFVSRYFHKGQLVAVCGRIQTRSCAVTLGLCEMHFVCNDVGSITLLTCLRIVPASCLNASANSNKLTFMEIAGHKFRP